MTINAKLEADVIRLYRVEKWTVGTIAAQLNIHRDTVHRCLGKSLRTTNHLIPRQSILHPYTDFIETTLLNYPALCASRIYHMIWERGYRGSAQTVRIFVRQNRPKQKKEAFLMLKYMAGEQAQIDWAHVGRYPVPGGERALWVFVIVLSYSRAIWAELVLDLTAHSLSRSLIRAHQYFGGTTRSWLFDNAKIVVQQREKDIVKYHPDLLNLSEHYNTALKVCDVRKPHQKGRVERCIRYLKDSFFSGRKIYDLAEGNRNLLRFISEVTMQRRHPEESHLTIADAFEKEKSVLLPLPNKEIPLEYPTVAKVNNYAFVRFDRNDYSVPWEYAGKTISIFSDDFQLRMVDIEQQEEICRHKRVWGKKQKVLIKEHHLDLVIQRSNARSSQTYEKFKIIFPDIEKIYQRWADCGFTMSTQSRRLNKLADMYGEEKLIASLKEAIKNDYYALGAIEQYCEKLRRQEKQPVNLTYNMPEHPLDKNIQQHRLDGYDD